MRSFFGTSFAVAKDMYAHPMIDPTPTGALERRFALAERGTNVRTEVLAGVTTFLTMAYIVLVNPSILGAAGMPVAAVAAATCLAAAFASILMGFVANVPLALAPGMGLNAYFSFTVVQGMGVPWPVALGCVLISGIVFLALTLVGVRQMIVAAIPRICLPRWRAASGCSSALSASGMPASS
jgi:AGZA family xanthine/uracil permease-like MFS transporter